MDIETFVYQYEDERHVRIKIEIPGQETDLVFEATEMDEGAILETVREKINTVVPKLIESAKLGSRIEETVKTVEADLTDDPDITDDDLKRLGEFE